ncbi:uncharacterized protein C8R40DRAFT_1033681 [Lentinula edodes]|uniref:uncharacterized protein n=1 Tax=Lentinula edodes TaxID=5353 RepID=UPI001E8E6F43|nr:uncharacterized protein C8R40DRAFT_1033681 [Lentinula edodes]KAH7880809.1 hypothetical protein C8R40DRAFT_1033681 [Lentinula edodes]
MTDPDSLDAVAGPLKNGRVKKRIIVCCDGVNLQPGVTTQNRLSYTNVLRLARTIEHEDFRTVPPTPQIVFYQSGIGSADNFYSEYVEGDKVEEAYAFIAHNYYPGDEVFLFGFSRGAYTARMVAMFIGAIGILDRQNMDSFAGIFIAYQNLGKTTDEKEKQKLNAQLAPWNGPNSAGIRRAYAGGRDFSVKCLGVFETVGTLGLPEEITMRSPKLKRLFGFPDRLLGPHIERAYQALALNETRADFVCAKFEQKEEGRKKGQILKQVSECILIFGSRSMIFVGGGYKDHDLADISLTWMVVRNILKLDIHTGISDLFNDYKAHVNDSLAMDMKYLGGLLDPMAPWGTQKPHDPETGIFALSIRAQRPLPTKTDDTTHEKIHPSVLHQKDLYPALAQDIRDHPELIGILLPLEEEVKQNWPFNPTVAAATLKSEVPDKGPGPHPLHEHRSLSGKLAHGIAKATSSVLHKVSGDDEKEKNHKSA